MNWKKRLAKLPPVAVAVQIAPIQPEQCIEGIHNSAKFIAGHEYIPKIGLVYHFSISGPRAKRIAFIREVIAELGSPIMVNESTPEIWHYCWKSPSNEIPETNAHKMLGKERIDQICKQFGLNDAERRMLDEILATYQFFTGLTDARVEFMRDFTSNMQIDRREALTLALLQITMEFANRAHSH